MTIEVDTISYWFNGWNHDNGIEVSWWIELMIIKEKWIDELSWWQLEWVDKLNLIMNWWIELMTIKEKWVDELSWWQSEMSWWINFDNE